MRLSLTDRCNLRCIYCMPAHGVKAMQDAHILTYEDMLFLAQTAVALGWKRFALPGENRWCVKGFRAFCNG